MVLRTILALALLVAANGCLPDNKRCDGCQAIVESVVQLGDTLGDGMLQSTVVSLSFLSDGRFVIYDWQDIGKLRVYGANGEFERVIGRPGQGPGEFENPSISFLRDGGEELVIIDRSLRRATVLSSDGANSIAVVNMPPFFSVNEAVVLRDGRFIVNAISYEDQALGMPLHFLDDSMRLLRSFGADPVILGDWDSNAFTRKLARSTDGSVWAAPLNRYLVERWDTAGNRIRRIERSVDWFPAVERVNFLPDSPEEGPTAHLGGLWEDDAGRLWVIINVPGSDWQDHIEPYTRSDGTRRYRIRSHPYAVYEARVEVLHAETGELLASGRGPLGVSEVLDNGYAVTPFLDTADQPKVQVWRLSLNSPDPRRLR